MGVWKRLFQVMFYVGIPLTIPAAYGYYAGEPIWQAIAASAILLMLPALPSIIAGGFGRVAKFLGGVKYWILKRNEKSWNEGVAEGLSEIGKKMEGMTLGEALCLTSIAWLLIPAITIIPYIYAGLAPEDAYFESMSTWTATGLSVVDTPEAYPSSLLLFRSVSQWIGGLGIVILMIAVLKGREARTLLKAEGREGVEKSVGKTVHTYWKIYLVLSVLGFALLFSLGFGIFDAVNLAMAGISNGGMFPFSSYDFTDAHKYALAGLMFAGATSFVFYKKVGSGRIMEAVRDEEFLTYILLIIAGSGLIYLVGQENLTNSILNTISALACGGFAIGDVMVMHDFSKYSLMLLMICGGMYGSTTGAIKLWR
ncbi:MAG TPA: potassium transporter TrkG, partial [Candidatus Bilamarchaeaceae archaeon]|nr:potassium transporter TrkG [Candidatus Bilamarchaeaceae archaeon]